MCIRTLVVAIVHGVGDCIVISEREQMANLVILERKARIRLTTRCQDLELILTRSMKINHRLGNKYARAKRRIQEMKRLAKATVTAAQG